MKMGDICLIENLALTDNKISSFTQPVAQKYFLEVGVCVCICILLFKTVGIPVKSSAAGTENGHDSWDKFYQI